MQKMPIIFQRIEAAVIALVALYFSSKLPIHWSTFMITIIAVDVSMIGYLVNPRVGAVVYNIGHSLFMPAIILMLWYDSGSRLLLTVALAWVSHIGIDRAIGLGLKYPDNFKHTHLQ